MEDKKLIIFLDSGDTIIDEGTEIRNDNGIQSKKRSANTVETGVCFGEVHQMINGL